MFCHQEFIVLSGDVYNRTVSVTPNQVGDRSQWPNSTVLTLTIRLVTMLEDSDDPVVKTVQRSIKTGRKWKVAEAIDEAKECMKMKEVIGQTQTDRKGLGSSSV
ncbi:reverse transcriptase [Elysia marginata]|uniref:Reverse transcriptase n=1 Tax=Elysia marginata TaxID=1093978 RepID=A0AAV4IA12_9GAST|nr:reverse transcriptase [Elysia marginata]